MLRIKSKVKAIFIVCMVAFYYCFISRRTDPIKPKAGHQKRAFHMNANFSKLKDKSLYIFSAYADLRFGNVVRMVGMAIYDDYEYLTCVILHRQGEIERVSTTVKRLAEDHDLRYGAIFVLCKSAFPLSNGTMVGLSDHDDELDFLIPVQVIPSVAAGPVQGMTVCYPPLHSGYDDVEQFVENIEMNRILGFRQFFVYVHEVGPRVHRAITSYAKEGIVRIVSWEAFPLVSGSQSSAPEDNISIWARLWTFIFRHTEKSIPLIHCMGQMVAINDCLYRAMNNPFRVVAFHDFDELLIPHRGWSLSDIVAKEMGPSVSDLMVCCAMFKTQIEDDKDVALEFSLKGSPRLRTQLKTKRLDFLPPYIRSKMIVAADKVITMGIHFVWQKTTTTHNTVILSPDKILLHHYREWEENSHNIVDRVAWKYGQNLLPNVKRRLKQFDL